MDSSEVGLEIMEAQRSTDVSHEERKQGYSPINLIKRTLRSLGFLQVQKEGTHHRRDTKTVPEFLINIRLSDILNFSKESVPMTPKRFSEACAGNKKCLEELETPIACLKSERGDSMLHLVATWGHLELVKRIVSECPSLLLVPNSKGQLPLHVAACTGQLHVIKALVAAITFLSAKLPEGERKRLNLYVAKDKDGDTPLHVALKDHKMETAFCLLKANQQASFLANKDNKSPLYLAVEAGNVSVVREMLNTTGNEGRDSNLLSQLEGRKNLVHAALKAKKPDILDAILKKYPSLEDERDENGMTCLSFGASIGYYEGVCKLLDKSKRSIYVRNDDGSFPIHIAVEAGHMEIVMELIKRCPDSKYLLNKQGQNILHIAVKGGRTRRKLINNIKISEFKKKHLMVEQDVDGNTPLHIATQNWSPLSIFLLLIFNPGTNWKYTRNNKGLTALDIAEKNLDKNYIFIQRVTLMVLLTFDASSSTWSKTITRPSEPLNNDQTKGYVSTLLVIAGLVATVTFAAGFTIPGGFVSSEDTKHDIGRAVLDKDLSTVLFVVFDTLAMQSSILTIATLLWSQFGDPALVHRSLDYALPLLFFSLLCMSAAFCSGVLVGFIQVTVLVVFLSITFACFFVMMVFYLGPHVILHIPDVPAGWGFYFVPFVMTLIDDCNEQTSSTGTSGNQDPTQKKEST